LHRSSLRRLKNTGRWLRRSTFSFAERNLVESFSNIKWGSFQTIEQHASGWNELEQNVIVADIRSQDNQAELLRLKEQHAILERAELAVLFVALEAAEYPRQQRSTSENLGVRRKDTMRWHRSDLLADHVYDSGGSRVGRIQYADRVHQFLDRDSRMIDLSLRDQIVQDLGRTILHLVDVNGGIKQKSLPAD
jgi:hypothetical protein